MFRKQFPVSWAPDALISDNDQALLVASGAVFDKVPHLLCRWHIEKDVLAKCKQYFRDGAAFEMFHAEWMKIMRSGTEAIYQSSWQKFVHKYSVTHAEAIRYLVGTWIEHDKKFVSCYTDRVFHLGSGSSSRVEGAHAVLKGFLGSSKGDLYYVLKQME